MFKKYIVHKVIDLIDVPLAFIMSISLMKIKDFLGIAGLILTMAYTIWKWQKEYRNK